MSAERKILVQSLEMINGRVAMLATVGFAIQEAYTGCVRYMCVRYMCVRYMCVCDTVCTLHVCL